jgi:hypothetical protein
LTPDELAAELAAEHVRPAYLLAGSEPLLRDDAPELISRPRTMQVRMIIFTICLAAILVGSMIGFIRRANDPTNILIIQAREAR